MCRGEIDQVSPSRNSEFQWGPCLHTLNLRLPLCVCIRRIRHGYCEMIYQDLSSYRAWKRTSCLAKVRQLLHADAVGRRAGEQLLDLTPGSTAFLCPLSGPCGYCGKFRHLPSQEQTRLSTPDCSWGQFAREAQRFLQQN